MACRKEGGPVLQLFLQMIWLHKIDSACTNSYRTVEISFWREGGGGGSSKSDWHWTRVCEPVGENCGTLHFPWLSRSTATWWWGIGELSVLNHDSAPLVLFVLSSCNFQRLGEYVISRVCISLSISNIKSRQRRHTRRLYSAYFCRNKCVQSIFAVHTMIAKNTPGSNNYTSFISA